MKWFQRPARHEHQWNRWLVTKRAAIEKSELPMLAYLNGAERRYAQTGWLIVQERTCMECGFIEVNRQEVEL